MKRRRRRLLFIGQTIAFSAVARLYLNQAAFLAVSTTFAVASLVMSAALVAASLTTWVKLDCASVAKATNSCARTRSFSPSAVASSTCLVMSSAGVFTAVAAVAWAMLHSM